MPHSLNLLSSSWASPNFGGSLLGNSLLIAVVVWSIVWKGFALWRAAKNDSKVWFIIFLCLNTVGILEILYLYVFSKKKAAPQAVVPTEEKKEV